MSFKKELKKLLAWGGVQIIKRPYKGIDLDQDIQDFLPNVDIKVVFDIGANIGQSACSYQSCYPTARIYCFEPVKEAFETLIINVDDDPNIHCHNIALSSKERLGSMLIEEDLSVMNSLIADSDGRLQQGKTEEVKVKTFDNFCLKNDITKIDFVKIDTEGSDLEVLKGAVSFLEKQQISIIQVETGMNPSNTHHVTFEDVKSYLESFGYRLFGIYEQVVEWPINQTQLRRANSVFISQDIQKINL
jgi:FkbM family methyltransferase